MDMSEGLDSSASWRSRLSTTHLHLHQLDQFCQVGGTWVHPERARLSHHTLLFQICIIRMAHDRLNMLLNWWGSMSRQVDTMKPLIIVCGMTQWQVYHTSTWLNVLFGLPPNYMEFLGATLSARLKAAPFGLSWAWNKKMITLDASNGQEASHRATDSLPFRLKMRSD